MSADNTQDADLGQKINEIRQTIEKDPDTFTNSLQSMMDGMSRTALAYRDHGGQSGWSKQVRGTNGKQLWSPNQQKELENIFSASKQSGGALSKLSFRPGTHEDLIKTEAPLDLDLTKLSIDDFQNGLRQRMQQLDAVGRQLTRSLGLVKIVDRMDDIKIGPVQPYLPVPIVIPKRIIISLVNAFLESIRILSSAQMLNIPFIRSLSTFSLALFDLARGEWKDAVLTSFGLINTNTMMMGILGKVTLWVQNFISPEIQMRLEDDLFAASKSLGVGFGLWLFTLAAPKEVQGYVNSLVEKVKGPLAEVNEKLEDAEKEAGKVAAKAGVQVKFPRIPLDQIPSMDDIQNLQSLLQKPEIYCLEEVRELLNDAATVPGLRLFIELLNIPMDAEALAEKCKDIPRTAQEAALKSLEPTIIPLEPSKGGARRGKYTLRRKRAAPRRRTLTRPRP